MSEKFPSRIVLGEGWPFYVVGDSGSDPLRGVQGMAMSSSLRCKKPVRMMLGDDDTSLLSADDCPKYRLVLERCE